MHMITNFDLRLQNSKKLVVEGVMGVYMKSLECSPTIDVVNLGFIMLQIYLNIND